MTMSKLPTRRNAVIAMMCAASAAIAPDLALAQEFPFKPIRIVVGFGPGVGMEVSTRLMADLLAKELGQTVLVENKAGASTMIAAQAVATAPKDGYTVLMLNNQTNNMPLLSKNVPYKLTDFTPVAAGGLVSMVMAVSKSVPIKTGREFIAYAKANPDKLNYAYWGAGGTPHLMAARLEQATGVKMQGVGYKDPAQATTDMVSGRVHLFFTSATHGMGLASAGHVNIVAVGTPQRMASMPDVPTFAESGIEGMPNPWWGYGVPTGTPPDVIAKLERAIKAAVAAPAYQEMLTKTGSVPLVVESPAKFQEFMSRDQERWAAAIRPLNLKMD